MKPEKKTPSAKHVTFPLPALLLLLLLLFGIASYSYWAISQESTHGVLAKKAVIADLTAAVLKERCDRLKDLGVSFSERPLLRQWVEEGNWSQVEQMFQELLKEFPIINRFVLVDASGKLMMDTPAIPLVRGKDFAYRDWFKGVSKNGQPYLSEIFSRVPEPHEHQVGMAVPIRSNTGSLVGVLQLQELVGPLFAWGKEVEVGPAGFVYFVDQHGNITGHPKFSAQGEIINFSKVPAVQRVLQGKKGAEVFFDPVEKQELVLAYEPVPGYGWGVIVQQPAAAAFAQRQKNLRLLLFIYGGVFFLVFFLSIGILRALAERNRAEQIIKEARDYAENIIQTVREPLIVLDRDLKVVSANRSFYQTFKVNPEETQGQFVYDLGNRQWDIPKLRQLLEEILPKNTTFNDYEVEHDLKTLGPRTMLLNGRRIYRETNRTQMILLAIEDITERKRAEERLRLIIEAAPNGMIMVGREGKIALVNTQTEKLFGYSQEELLGQRIEMLVPERYRSKHPGYRDSFFADPKARSIGAGRDLFGLKKDGTEIPIEIGLNPIETPEGLFTLASIIDITERKRTEKELQERTDKLQRFHSLTVGRELEMVRLKKEINSLLEQLGQPGKYRSPSERPVFNQGGNKS